MRGDVQNLGGYRMEIAQVFRGVKAQFHSLQPRAQRQSLAWLRCEQVPRTSIMR